ncbi:MULTISPECIES: dihydroxyacetone kinase phosphoryl donor subunit DhaM [unclassified Pseudactinotalea]|uniref:dihydroxyacetone kinase phosphoryl donor subunit DhaM n=1 Tax=Micrococcales TaxID=85006 RepID=UPI003C7AA4B9
MVETALVLVSHSGQLARGCAQVAAQMAPDVTILAAGGTSEEGIGTSYDLVESSVRRALADGAGYVVLLADLGSALLTAESVQEMLADERVLIAHAPFVEGAVAAAVSAQSGADGEQVRAAAHDAIDTFGPPEVQGPGSAPGNAADDEAAVGEDDTGVTIERTLTVRNRLGLHARPAAMLARQVAEFDARVSINGVDATSVLALMGLGLTGGARIDLVASGAQAEQAVETITADVEAGFGEE